MKEKSSNKICFFNTTKAWGGGEKWHFDVSNYLFEKGHDLIFICSKNSDLHKRLQNTQIKHYALDIHGFSYLNPLKVRQISKILKNENINSIIMNLSSDVKLAAHAAKKAGVARIIYRRGSAIPLKNTFYNRYIFKHWVNEILVNSDETKRTINQNNPDLFPENKITLIYNGININNFSDCEDRKNSKLILGNVARLEYQKGHKYLIEIARILKDKGLDFELRIVGQGSLYQKIEKMITENKLSDYVQLLGFRSDINVFLKDIDIFLLSSLWEGFGYVIAEAMACYIPVVAFNVSSNPEIVDNNKTGYLVSPFDTQAFANAVIKLANDKDLRKNFGINARKRTETLFDKEKSLRQIEAFLIKN